MRERLTVVAVVLICLHDQQLTETRSHELKKPYTHLLRGIDQVML